MFELSQGPPLAHTPSPSLRLMVSHGWSMRSPTTDTQQGERDFRLCRSFGSFRSFGGALMLCITPTSNPTPTSPPYGDENEIRRSGVANLSLAHTESGRPVFSSSFRKPENPVGRCFLKNKKTEENPVGSISLTLRKCRGQIRCGFLRSVFL